MPFVLFRSSRPRHPVARVLFGVLGVAVLGGILVFGLFAALVLLLVGAVAYLVRQLGAGSIAATPQSPARSGTTPDGVLEGEFVVVRDPASRLPR